MPSRGPLSRSTRCSGSATWPVSGVDALTLDLVQPSAWRRVREPGEGGRVRAPVRMPGLRSTSDAEVDRRRWTIEREGSRLRRETVVIDEAGRRELARLRRDGRRSVLVVGRREAEWRKLGRKQGYGAVDVAGTTLAAANLRSSWRTQGTVVVDDALRGDEAVAAALLAAVLAVRKLEEQAAAAA